MPMRSQSRPRWAPILLSLGILGLGWLGWLYLSQEVPSLVTVDAQSGKVLWSASINNRPPIQKVITHKGQVYTLAFFPQKSCGNWCFYIPFLSPTDDELRSVRVTAFDVVSGKQLWQFKTESNESDRANIGVAEDSVLLKTDQITALDPTRGQTQWSLSLPVNAQRPYEGAPSFSADMVVSRDRVALLRVLEPPKAGTSRVSVETWQKTTGKQHQTFAPISSSSSIDLDGSSLAATDETILLFLPWHPSAKISGYAPETGKLKFSITTVIKQGNSTQDFYRYVQFGGSTLYQYIYNGTNQGKSVIVIEAYDANTGELRWQVPISDSRCVSFSAVSDGASLSCNGSSSSPAYVKFLDEKTGQPRSMKRFTEGTWLESASTGSSDALIFARVHTSVDAERESIRLVAFAKTDGRELWSVDSSETSLYGADRDRVFLNLKASRLSNLGIRF